MKRLLLLPLLCAPQVGCVETVTVRQAVPDSVEALVSVPRQAWRVERGSELVGLVIRFDPAHGDHDRFHSVRNPWNQELGMVDADGRAWRFRTASAGSWGSNRNSASSWRRVWSDSRSAEGPRARPGSEGGNRPRAAAQSDRGGGSKRVGWGSDPHGGRPAPPSETTPPSDHSP